jgi:predicted  nucleic acid-binding Zn-ribbon protein
MSEQENIIERQKIIDQTRKEDERSDLKQHADKMLRDFEKFNDHSSNRAIWELVQNACDLTIDCEIEIDYRENRISFSHNGKAFNTKSLISLIKQVSGKYGIQEEEDIPEVGKYGTGFLTTHSFGRKFIIDSVLHTGSYYIPITNFEIDRSPKTWELLSDNISDQKKIVYDILKNEKSIDCTDISTTFTYLPQTPKEFEYIERSLLNLDNYIPLVFTVNDRLKKVKIIDNENTTIEYNFKEKNKVENDQEINLYQTIISKNSSEIHLYSIIDLEDEIEIILPINKEKEVFEFDEHIARLFLYYPLIGSEKFGINFIINCKKFLPTEPRDGIHINSDKDQVKDQEEKNREIINKCTEIIFTFLNSNILDVSNPLLYTNVNFKTNSDNQLLNEYYEKLQIDWNEKLELLPFVKTIEGYKTIKEVDYFSEEFLNSDAETLDSFYELISKFYTLIPLKEEVIMWSNNAANWKSDSINFITHNDLLEKISECNLEDFNKDTLKSYYQHLIDFDQSNIFNDYKLLPNIEGYFHKFGNFLLSEDLNSEIIELGKILIPEKVNQLIDKDFIFNFNFNSFNQRNFSDEVKNELDKLTFENSIFINEKVAVEYYHDDLIKRKEKIDLDFFNALFNFCKLSYSKDSNNKPIQLIKLIAKYYDLEDNLILLPNVDDKEKVELRTVRKDLFEIFFNLISIHKNKWVKENINLIYDIHKTYDDSNKDVFKASHIYPNQLFELCPSESLKRDNNVTEDIKIKYKEITGEDINEKLSIIEFNPFISKENTINNRYLTTIIEDKIFSEGVFNIDGHPYKDTILKIIPKLNDKEYQNLFPQLNDRKASIMISVVTKEETKDDIFAIVTLDNDKLKSIGKLISNPDFESILNQAMSNVEDAKQTKANFQFKHQIGTHIEDVLKEHLKNIFNPEDIKYEVKGEQDGQDIIIKIKDEVKYFIEVKSRWDKRTSIKMSKNQTLRANEQKIKYALCSVDMSEYEGDDRFKISDISKISGNIIFVNDIGTHVEHLIAVLKQTNKEEEIHLDGDYRTLVPQSIINEFGISISEFETYLIDLLKK